jgi:hypothetical protein
MAGYKHAAPLEPRSQALPGYKHAAPLEPGAWLYRGGF